MMHTLACAVTAWLCAAFSVHAMAALRKTQLSTSGGLLVIAAHRFGTVPLFVWSSDWQEEGVLRLLRLLPIIEVIFCLSSFTLAPVPIWFDVFAGSTNIFVALVTFRRNPGTGNHISLREARQVPFIVCLWIVSTAACAYWSFSQRRRSWMEQSRTHESRIHVRGAGVVVGTALSRGREQTRLLSTVVPCRHNLGSTEAPAGLVQARHSGIMELEPGRHAACAQSSTMMDPGLLHPMPPSDSIDTITKDAGEAIHASVDHTVRRSQPGGQYSRGTSGHDVAPNPASEVGNSSHITHLFYDAPVQVGLAVLADVPATIARPSQHEAALITPPRGSTDGTMGDAGMPRALPPYTPFQPSLDAAMALKARPRAYIPFLRHHVTHVKLQGVEPSMIQPGYQERLRELIHLRTGRWLSHVYVRAGCIELVLDCEEWGSGVLTRGSPCSTWSASHSYCHSASAEADPDLGSHVNGVTAGDSRGGEEEGEAAGPSGSSIDRKKSACSAVNSVTGQQMGNQLDGEAEGIINCRDGGREDGGSGAADGQSFVAAGGGSSGNDAEHRQRCSTGAGWHGVVEEQGGAAARTQPRTLRATRAVTAHQFGVVPAHAGATASDGCSSLNPSTRVEIHHDPSCEARCRPLPSRCNYHANTGAEIGAATSFMDSLDSSAGGVGTWEVVRALQLQSQPLNAGECVTGQCTGVGSGSGLGTPRCATIASMMSPSLLEGRAAAIATAAAVSPLSRELRLIDGDGSGDNGFSAWMSSGAIDSGARSGQMTGGAPSANTTASAFDSSMLFVEGQATTRHVCDSTACRASCQPRITSLEPRILLAARSLPNTSNRHTAIANASAEAGYQAASADAMASGSAVATSVSSSVGASQSFRRQADGSVGSIATEPALRTEPSVTLKAIVRCNAQLLCNGALQLLVRAEGRYLPASVTRYGPSPPGGGDDAAAGDDVDCRISYDIQLPMIPLPSSSPSSSSSFSVAASSLPASLLPQPLRPGILLVDLRVQDVPVHAAPVVVVHDAAIAPELCAALATAQLSDDDRDSLLMDLGTWVFHVAAARGARKSENPRGGGGGRSNVSGRGAEAHPPASGPAAVMPSRTTREGLGSRGTDEDHESTGRLTMLGMHLLSYAKAAGWRCTAASLAADLAAMGVEVDCSPPGPEPAVGAAGRPHAMDGILEVAETGGPHPRIPGQGVVVPPAGCAAAARVVASMSTSARSTASLPNTRGASSAAAAVVRWAAGKVLTMAKTLWKRLHLAMPGSLLANIAGFLSWPASDGPEGAGLPPTVSRGARGKGSVARKGVGGRRAHGESQRIQPKGQRVLPSQLEGCNGRGQPQLPRTIDGHPHLVGSTPEVDVPPPAQEHGNSTGGSPSGVNSSMASSMAACGSRPQGPNKNRTTMQNATEVCMSAASGSMRRDLANNVALVACKGGSGGGGVPTESGPLKGGVVASNEASPVSDAAGGPPEPLTPLGALLVECGLRRLPSAEESAYQMYAASRIAAQGSVITLFDVLCLGALTARIYQNPASAQWRLTVLACWVGVVEVLMQAGGFFRPPLSMDWPKVHGVCKILRYMSYMTAKILCALRVVDMPPGIDNYVTGVSILVQEGLVHPASCLLSLRVLVFMTLLRLVANVMIVSTVDEHFKGSRLGRGGSFMWAAAISAAELLTSGAMHVSLRLSHSRRATEKRHQVVSRQMFGRG